MIDLISEIRNGFTELRVGQKRFSRARGLIWNISKYAILYEFEKGLKLT